MCCSVVCAEVLTLRKGCRRVILRIKVKSHSGRGSIKFRLREYASRGSLCGHIGRKRGGSSVLWAKLLADSESSSVRMISSRLNFRLGIGGIRVIPQSGQVRGQL